MPQNFIECDREQELLLPTSMRDWLPEDHLAFRVLAANQIPDHATIARFRARHEQALADTFEQVLAAGRTLRGVGGDQAAVERHQPDRDQPQDQHHRPRLAANEARRHELLAGLQRPGPDQPRAGDRCRRSHPVCSRRHRACPNGRQGGRGSASGRGQCADRHRLADGGYWSSPQISEIRSKGIEVVIPTRNRRRTAPRKLSAKQGPEADRMEAILATPEGRALYRRRQQIVEPVFANTKYIRRAG